VNAISPRGPSFLIFMPGLRFILLSALLAFTPLTGRATTALLLLQGNFNNDSNVETSRWAVTYSGNTLMTGEDLLMAVFGAPHFNSTTSLYTTNPTTFADGSTWQISYGDSAFDFIEAMTRNGQTLTNSTDFSVEGSSWNYWAANGNSGYVAGDPYAGIVDANGWHSSAVGIAGRTLADPSTMSFDGWDFGDNGYDPNTGNQAPPLSIAGYSPNISSFSGAGVNLISAPEPGRVTMLLIGGMLTAWCRRKTLPAMSV
jgi:hypothetical protein